MRGSSLGRSTTHSNDLPPLGTLELLDENSEGEHSAGDSIEGGHSTGDSIESGARASTNNAKKSKKDGYKRDARGRIYVHLRGDKYVLA